METIRVINFPCMKMISSGPIKSSEDLEAFDKWWSKIDMKDYITPRDFMYHDKERNCMIWLVAAPIGLSDIGEYEVIDFPGGLYAVGTAKDGDEIEINKVKNNISLWVKNSGCFVESNERYSMAHICTPKIFKEKMGYHLTDVFTPIDIL